MESRGREAETRGFTLVELLVVLAMVAIVVSLAIPNYRTAKANAYNATAASDARQFVYAAEALAGGRGLAEPVVLSGAGGPIDALPGATASPGTLGLIDVSGSRYLIEVHHASGNLCYQYSSTTPGVAVLDPSACRGVP